jgi:hypothetical protein
MALTAAQTVYFESRLGAPLDEADLEARLARLGAGKEAAAAVEVLETRLATSLATPLRFSVPGEYSEDRSDNVSHVRDMLELAQGEAGEPAGFSTLRAVLPATARWGR